MTNRNDWTKGCSAERAQGAHGSLDVQVAQDAIGIFMAKSIAVIQGLTSRGGDGLSTLLEGLGGAEEALRGLGASGYFISRLTWLVIEAMDESDHLHSASSLDISYFADFLRGGRAWDA